MKRILNKVASYFKFIRDRKNNLNELEMTLAKEAFCGHENDEKIIVVLFLLVASNLNILQS